MKNIADLVATALDQPVDKAFEDLAAHLRQLHGGRVRAILGYGSALRGTPTDTTLLDFYVLTAGFDSVSAHPLARLACRLVPPNVYYAELNQDGTSWHAKYAVMPLDQFVARMGSNSSNPYFWARFCQPARLLYSADAESRQAVISAAGTALATMYGHCRALSPGMDPLEQFAAGFAATYRTELRPEAPGRNRVIVDANPAYYRTAAALLADTQPRRANWPIRRAAGKTLSLLRLGKAAFTFRGGVDYAAWKIARHSGQMIELTDWHRRHPLLTGLWLLPRLLRKGTLR